MDELIERIAQLIFEAGGGKSFMSKQDWIKDHYRKLARIAINEVKKSKIFQSSQ